MRSIVTTNIDTEQGQEEFKSRMNQILRVLEEHGRIMSKTEKDIFDIEHKFYVNVRNETSERISELFEEGFFWMVLLKASYTLSSLWIYKSIFL